MRWRQYVFPAAVLAIAAIAGIVVLIVNSAGDGGGEESASGCEDVSAPEPKDVRVRKPTFRLQRSKRYLATVETSCGTFTIQLDPRRAPATGGSFVTLAQDSFYDGLG